MKLVEYDRGGLSIYGARIFTDWQPRSVRIIPVTNYSFYLAGTPIITESIETMILHSAYSYIVSKE